MPPIATASAPSSLLPLRIARQGIREEKVKPRLDDGGVGFPPFRFGGGGGGGGGGGSSSSGGFILFVIVLLLDYLREVERNLQNGSRRGNDYDNGLAPQ
ncbi:hypothetical protein BAE44_0015747 [Dichanthelium oligosanthes]|uniref:Uncharacterized protein n=1 Tax=Dichanthelium oligosanthes TaxID=888268 RepID=A0A1E5VDK5_9POAL|nr:hypothetical protein BAE44_0015747 [Dichanthelium oligosanthes]